MVYKSNIERYQLSLYLFKPNKPTEISGDTVFYTFLERWEDPMDDGGMPVTSYTVEAR